MQELLGTLATPSSRLVAMAVALVGETKKIRDHMKLSEADLAGLLAGDRELTWTELDLLTTLLIREQGSMIAQNRELAELIRSRATPRA